ncbi:hypothetical protein C7E12_20265, partial [Stenotrophomonas maltophilia]
MRSESCACPAPRLHSGAELEGLHQEDAAGLLPQPAADHHRCRSADPAADAPAAEDFWKRSRCDRSPAPAQRRGCT